jgi:hypothetical protein
MATAFIDAPAPQDHVVRIGLADLQPLRLLLAARRRDGNLDQVKAILLRQRLQHRQGFLAERRVVIQVDDLFSFELVHAAVFIAEIFDHRCGLVPVAGDERENIGEDLAVGGVRAAVADHRHRDFVGGEAVKHAVGDAGGQRFDQRGAAVFRFQPFVALDAARRVVFGLAFFPNYFDAVHAARQVDQVEVVDDAAIEAGTARRIRADAVGGQGDVLSVHWLRDGGAGRCECESNVMPTTKAVMRFICLLL